MVIKNEDKFSRLQDLLREVETAKNKVDTTHDRLKSAEEEYEGARNYLRNSKYFLNEFLDKNPELRF